MFVYYNGVLSSLEEATVNLADRGLLLGDGAFTTMRSYKGEAFSLNDHWERLVNNLELLRIPIPITFKNFIDAVDLMLTKNDLLKIDARLRVTVTRGVGPRGLIPQKNLTPTYFITASAITDLFPDDIHVIISKIRRNEFSPLSNIKSINYLDNILARMEAKDQHADEALLFNTAGNLAEASASNVFIVRNNEIVTPPLQDGALPGITRKMVLNLCKDHQLDIQEASITERDLYGASEVFLTNSLIEIKSVKKMGQLSLPNETPVTEILKKEYRRIVSGSSDRIMRRSSTI